MRRRVLSLSPVRAPQRRLWSTTFLSLLALTVACKAAEVPPQPEISPEQQAPATQEPDPGIVLTAAGISITLPSTWTIIDDHELDFAVAQGPGVNPPTCTIELRRQGSGELPKGARERDGDFDFTRGQLRVRMRMLPGPTASATVVLHCLAPRAAQWAAIEAAFDSQTSARVEPSPSPSTAAGPIAELCTGTPAHLTYACVRRTDGAVYCGPSDGDVLTRITDIPAAVQIGCEGARACSRSAAGELHCWKADTTAQLVSEITEVRDLAGGCVVDARGKVSCRQRESNGMTSDTFAELVPLGDPAFALSDVEHVLAGSSADQGCVLGPAGLRCWDHAAKLRLSLPDTHQPHVLAAPAAATDLATIGGRVCVARAEQWTCLDGDNQFEFVGCERDACGCSLAGATRLSCDHEPYEHGGVLLGRIADVIAVDGACAVLRDGTPVCRGPVAGRVGDSPRIEELVAAGRGGVLHVLELREPVVPAEPSEQAEPAEPAKPVAPAKPAKPSE